MTSSKSLRSELEKLIERALLQRIATSISLYVGFGVHDSSKDIFLHGDHKPGFIKTPHCTIYDLASLTKIIGTSVAIAKAISDGKMSLKETPFKEWPQVTIASLLAHTSGLQAHKKFYADLKLAPRNFSQNQQLIFNKLFSSTIENVPHEHVYSDLGFMALGFLLEKRLKKPLFEILKNAWNTLKIDEEFLWFPSMPLFFKSDNQLVAPTGFCHYRHNEIFAQVHDPNCYFLGGLAGHAGLFGTLGSVKNIGQYFLKATKKPTTKEQEILQLFARKALGFFRSTTRGTIRNLSPDAFGHFGYTGTSLWIDPVANNNQGIIIALLTNRVHCSNNTEGIYWLRLALHRMILR
jgi:CubicO group peptidase (beta-lactamase class C family)